MKKHFHTYKKIIGLLPLLLLGFITAVQGQETNFEFKLQYLEEGNDSLWGVYVRPLAGFPIGDNDAVVGSGQITVLMRDNAFDTISNIQSVNGTWNNFYDIVEGPTEALGISYLFIGLSDGDGINLENGEETLLLTFQVPGDCPDTLGLIDNALDPFNAPIYTNSGNNSEGNNPGMDLSTFNSSTGRVHNWLGNYNTRAFSCDDCDNDGIRDGIEDTNGNGDYDEMIDSSAICDVCDPNGVNFYSATLLGGDTLTQCGTAGQDSIALMVNLTGGWSPFIITLEETNNSTNAKDTLVFTDYRVGDRIYVSPDSTADYRIVTITDSPPVNDSLITFCTIESDSLFDTIRVMVEGPLFFDLAAGGHPDHFTACNLDTLGFGVHAFSASGNQNEILYQWQVSSDSTDVNLWSDIENGTPYAFATTDSIVISNPLGLDGLFYRAKVYTPFCDTIFSYAAQLGVDGPFIIDVEAIDVSLCAVADSIYFFTETSVGQGNFNRRWQVSQDTGKTWTDVVIPDVNNIHFTGATAVAGGPGIDSIYHDTLHLRLPTAAMNKWQYRIAAIGQNLSACSEIYTDEATLTVEGEIMVTANPIDVAICSDTTACFGVTTSNAANQGTIQYQWYVQERGSSTWAAVTNDGTYSGARSDTLCVTNVIGRDSFAYRVEIQTTECNIESSASAILNVDGPIVFDVNARDTTICAGEDPNIFSFRTLMGQGVLSRRWQVNRNDNNDWVDLAMSDTFNVGIDSVTTGLPAGFETAYLDTLYIDTAAAYMDQWQFRLAVIGGNSNNCGDVYSEEAVLTVEGTLSIDNTSLIDVNICSDTTACFGVTVSSESTSGIIDYQWFVQERGSSTWTAVTNDGTYSGVRSNTLCVTNVIGRDSFAYRVEVSTGKCAVDTSVSAMLHVDGPILFDLNARDTTICAGEDPNMFSFRTLMGQGVLNRRWQVNRNDNNDWVDLAMSDTFNVGIDSVTTGLPAGFEKAYLDTLYIDTAAAYMDQWQFRLAVIGSNSNNCEDTYSREATLTVEGTISIVAPPRDVNICSDTTACFGVGVSSESTSGTIGYQWYGLARGLDASIDGNWTALNNDGTYSGVRSDTLCVTNVIGRDSFAYRVEVSTGKCAVETSIAAILSIDGPISFDTNADDVTVCAKEDPNFFAYKTLMGQGLLNRRWQVSTDTGKTWANVTYHVDSVYTAAADSSTAAIDLEVGYEKAYFDTLYIDTAVAYMNKWQYRLAAIGQNTNNCAYTFSREAILTVEGEISIAPLFQPMDVFLCSDTAACFGIQVINEANQGIVQYQWEKLDRGEDPTVDSNWETLSSSDGRYAGVRSDTMCVLFIAGQDSTRYRVRISTGLCGNELSEEAILNVAGPISYNAHPQDATVCAVEDPVTFTSVTAIGQGQMLTHWEVSIDTGRNWAAVDLGLPIYSEGRAIEEDISPGGSADSIYYDTLYISSVDSIMDHWLYKNVANGTAADNGCNEVSSEAAILTVEGVIEFVMDVGPIDVSICSDTAACFGVRVTNQTMQGNIRYQWEELPPGDINWITLTSASGRYGGVTSDTLCVNNVSGRDSFSYRVRIYTDRCADVYSDTAVLNVSGPIIFEVNPADVEICASEDTTFFTAEATIGEGGLTTRWQVNEGMGAGWEDIDTTTEIIYTITASKEESVLLPGIDSTYYSTLSLDSVTSMMDQWQYRIVANGLDGTSCQDISSDSARLTVNGILHIDADPRDTTVCAGFPTRLQVVTRNEASGIVRYQWQKKAGGIWGDLALSETHTGVRDSILSISNVTAAVSGLDSAFYRVAVFTDQCERIYSDSAKLKIEGPFVFDSEADSPHDTVVCAGEPIIFTANPVNQGFGEMIFEWKASIKGGIDYVDLSMVPVPISIFSGINTTQLTITPTTVAESKALDSTYFRLEITSDVCNDAIPSLRALLRVDGDLTIDLQPEDTTNCADKGVIFFANVTNNGYTGQDGIRYQWQELEHNGSGVWENVQNAGVYNGASTDTLSIDITTGLDSNRYRMLTWTSVCNQSISDTARLIEEGTTNFTDHPEDVIICSGEMTSFAARMVNSTGQGINIMNWQMSTNNGIDWTNIDTTGNPLFSANGAGPTATVDSTATAMSDTLFVNDVTGMQGYRFRAAVTSTYCDTVFSQLATLTVEGPFSATLMGLPTVCANTGVDIEADVVSEGAGLPELTWQWKAPDSTDFSDIPTTWGIFHGERTNGTGLKVLRIDSVLNENSRENLPAGVDTSYNFDQYEFRLSIVSDTCKVAVFSDTFILNIVADTIGACDWDLDGLTNTVDLDDDNDGLTDSVEVYITTHVNAEPQDSVGQFDTDTDNNSVTDNEEDADDDTISNGEEVDDDDGNGRSDGVDSLTGVFTGFPDLVDPNADPNDIFNGDPLDPCDPILSPSCIGVVIDINVKLQGAMPDLGFDETDAVLMTDNLRKDTLLPRISPYENFFVLDSLNTVVPAYVHVKRDSIAEEVSVSDSISMITFGEFGAIGTEEGNAVVDWVFIEIRDGAKLDSVVTTRAALLQRDGDVRDHRINQTNLKKDLEGYPYLSFDSTLAGDYYVVVRHRNHLGVMTNEAGLLSPIVTSVDFTDKDFNALGIHSQRMNADTTEQYMWAGDVTSDRKIIYQGPGNDVDEMFYTVITDSNNTDYLDNFIVPGYYRTDYNLDGRTIFQGPNNDRQMLIFQSILQFPDNKVKFLQNYVILEQLP